MAMKKLTCVVLITLAALLACSAAEGPPAEQKDIVAQGETIYRMQCAMCHGRKGNLSVGGAKDLTASTLSAEEMIAVVTQGKGTMAGFGNTLTKPQIEAVVAHARTLRPAAQP